MPTWTLRTRGDPREELVTADRLEVTPDTCAWWSVVVIIHDARWSCVRRISTAEVISADQLRAAPAARVPLLMLPFAMPPPLALARATDVLRPVGVVDPLWSPKWDGWRALWVRAGCGAAAVRI